MKLFDPQRPTSDGIALYAPQGTAMGHHIGLPVIYVDVGGTEGTWHATIHMPNSYNAYGGYEAKLASTEALTELFVQWLADPERTITEVFRYTPSAQANLRRAKAKVSERSVAQGLAELGLLDD